MIDWGGMLRAATTLGISPDRFWRLSLKEWRMLTEVGVAPMGRAEMERLAKAWPDEGSR